MKPGDCPNEGTIVKVGDGVKSFCEPWGRYTNCREVGHCVYEDACCPDENQMTIFDILEEECD